MTTQFNANLKSEFSRFADSHRPDLGPSDSSDSPNDLPPGAAATDSDSGGAGERASVAPRERTSEEDGADISPDRLIGEDEAGLAHTPPDPRRNGG